jgi:hypothetical protein
MSIAKFHKPYLSLDTKIGKEMLFQPPLSTKGDLFAFSSSLEKIGYEWDVELQSGTYVLVISEPVEINREKYGGIISVTKIQANVATDYHTIIKEFWVPTISLVEI